MAAQKVSFQIDPKRWLRLIAEPFAKARPALFLDRDGVMIEERGYLSTPGDVQLIEGCAELLAKARKMGLALVVVTNQSGIGRGYYSWQDYAKVENRLLEILTQSGIEIDAILANSNIACDTANNWRKPEPGMLLTARDFLNLSLSESIIIGDKASDLLAGRAAGLRHGVHVLSGHGAAERTAAAALVDDAFRVELVGSLGTCSLLAG